MKVIRDYIAHESSAARTKYIQSVLNNRPFIEPYQHLLTIKRGPFDQLHSCRGGRIDRLLGEHDCQDPVQPQVDVLF